jgi:hypothetical protein
MINQKTKDSFMKMLEKSKKDKAMDKKKGYKENSKADKADDAKMMKKMKY